MEPDADISGHILTAKGNDELNRKREISIIKELSLQPQIGLINVQNSFSGSCCPCERETEKMSASGVSADEILAKLKRLENF